jgi:Immunoglobulin-like domain of bacterial spore germination/Sporulation and spore germination
MKRLMFAAVLALAACAPDRSGSLGPAPTASPRATTDTPPSGSPAPPDSPTATRTITIQVWFTRAGKLFATKRTAPVTLETSRLALTELMTGPSAVEAAAGVGNAIPIGMDFDLRGISNGVATLGFPDRFQSRDAATVRLRQAQVVYTLTQYPSVSRVDFRTGAQPLGRADFADLVPRIVVLGPIVGQRVSSPLTVTGTADTREATVNVRLLDAAGQELATTFTTATCGNGCRGTYSVALAYQGCAEQGATIEAYQISGEDGSRRDVMSIPVLLSPC